MFKINNTPVLNKLSILLNCFFYAFVETFRDLMNVKYYILFEKRKYFNRNNTDNLKKVHNWE